MTFNFSKEFIGPYNMEEYGSLTDCRMFTVFTTNKPIGKFLYNKRVCFFSYGDEDIRIDIKTGIFRIKSVMVDQKSQLEIGKYKICDWSGAWIKKGRFTSKDSEVYRLRECKAKVNWSLFKKYASGQYRLEFGNSVDAVEYSFEMEGIRQISIGSRRQRFLPFLGIIELNSKNIFLVFAGFFLLERYFEYLDEGVS